MGGNIVVDDVDGNLAVNTMGGDINIGIIKGNSAKVIQWAVKLILEKACRVLQ